MNATKLDNLTTTVTAFETWAEFVASMKGGYCPTLRTKPITRRMSKATKAYEKAVKALRVAVRAHGFKVFDGIKVS